MNTSKISHTDGGRPKLASYFCQNHAAADRSSLVLQRLCEMKAGCISTQSGMEIVFKREISLSYFAVNAGPRVEYGMFFVSILKRFVIDFVSRKRAKAAVAGLKSSNFPLIYCVLLSQKRTKNSRIHSAFSDHCNVNSCVIAIEIRGDFVAGEYFVSVNFPDSKYFLITFDPLVSIFHDEIVWVSAAFHMSFIGLKSLLPCESESSFNDISLAKTFWITPFPSENGHEASSIHSAAAGQVRQWLEIIQSCSSAWRCPDRAWETPNLTPVNHTISLLSQRQESCIFPGLDAASLRRLTKPLRVFPRRRLSRGACRPPSIPPAFAAFERVHACARVGSAP
ncbi:hypothetical protein [Polaromonas sp. DSR2-3-2]|uniref:hypothetical protein n=1 Tax=unclassified Polaromonas TaxID=2638319 RepID=UPI003CEBC5AB